MSRSRCLVELSMASMGNRDIWVPTKITTRRSTHAIQFELAALTKKTKMDQQPWWKSRGSHTSEFFVFRFWHVSGFVRHLDGRTTLGRFLGHDLLSFIFVRAGQLLVYFGSCSLRISRGFCAL